MKRYPKTSVSESSYETTKKDMMRVLAFLAKWEWAMVR